LCHQGKNHFTEVQCRSMVSLEDLVTAVTSRDGPNKQPLSVRRAFTDLLTFLYFSVQEPVEGLDKHPAVVKLLR
ncbi:unnamed protein product, partial [Discosporangium mesarthrocarpum]